MTKDKRSFAIFNKWNNHCFCRENKCFQKHFFSSKEKRFLPIVGMASLPWLCHFVKMEIPVLQNDKVFLFSKEKNVFKFEFWKHENSKFKKMFSNFKNSKIFQKLEILKTFFKISKTWNLKSWNFKFQVFEIWKHFFLEEECFFL